MSLFTRFIAAALLLTLPAAAQPLAPTQFNYQGRLTSNGAAVNAPSDLSFTLYDAADAGNIIAGPITKAAVPVQNGVFTVALDFGLPAATASRWLEVAVLEASEATIVAPRTLISAVPAAAVAYAVPVYSGQPFVPFQGAVRFNPERNDFQGYNGLYWTSLSGKPNTPFQAATFSNSDPEIFTVPAGVTEIFIEAWGGGGGGGGCINIAPNCAGSGPTAGGAGGAGGYAASVLSVTPGDQLTIVVGPRGGLGANNNNLLTSGFPGTAGGDTSVTRNSAVILFASGGIGGNGGIWTTKSANVCIGNVIDDVNLGGGEGGIGSGGSYANTSGSSGGPARRTIECQTCCVPGTSKNTDAVPSAFAAVGLPGAVVSGAGTGGMGANAATNGIGVCPGTAAPASNGARGEVRIYWTTAP